MFIPLLQSFLFLTVVWAKCKNHGDKFINSVQADPDTVVNKHNEYRQLITDGKATTGDGTYLPSATNMGPLKWNNALQAKAQKLANECIFEHETQSIDGGKTQVGQNLYIGHSTAPYSGCDYAKYVDGWYEEIKDFSVNNINPFIYTEETAHFTQVAWAKTTDVGCACVNYKTNFIYAGKSYPYAQIVVCDYSPAGNVDNTEMYNYVQ